MDLLCLIDDIKEWGREKGINNPTVQIRKAAEETLETQEAYDNYVWGGFSDKWKKPLLEEVGDIGIVWILLCQALNVSLEDVLTAAHNKNKVRKGQTINGNFVKQEDLVSHPAHYQIEGRKECFDEMLEKFSTDEVKAFCELNAYKYRYRAGLKGDAETDIKKAEWYENKAKELK